LGLVVFAVVCFGEEFVLVVVAAAVLVLAFVLVLVLALALALVIVVGVTVVVDTDWMDGLDVGVGGLGDTDGGSTAAVDSTSPSGCGLLDLDLVDPADALVTVSQTSNRSLTDLLRFVVFVVLVGVMGGGGTELVAMSMSLSMPISITGSVSFSGSGLTTGGLGEVTPRVVVVVGLGDLGDTRYVFDDLFDVTLSHTFIRAATPKPTDVLMMLLLLLGESLTGDASSGGEAVAGCFEASSIATALSDGGDDGDGSTTSSSSSVACTNSCKMRSGSHRYK
jgi:hypothetical protein